MTRAPSPEGLSPLGTNVGGLLLGVAAYSPRAFMASKFTGGWCGRLEGAMSAWSKIDDLRAQVVSRSLAEGVAFAPERLVVLGWEIFLSRRRQGGLLRWHLSAKLYPHGRSSTENDWKIVGQIAARVGAPQDPVILQEDPAAPVHWSWIESQAARALRVSKD